jgi:isovaleryl-CoA dehydrogenase
VSTSSVVMNAADMVVGRLVRTDNADVRDRYLADVAGGRQIGCLAMTEPDAGSDVFSMRTTATPVSGGWQLDGEKVFITMAPVADFALVYARIGDDDFGLFLVRTDADGFTLGRPLEKMGWRGSPTCGFQLDACFVPDDDVLSAGGGRRVLLDGLDSERVVMAAMSTGLAQAALDASVEHARTRVQFGRRIGDFQMVQSKLAGMWADIEACRALTYRAAAADASAPRSLRGLASAAKLRAAGCAMQSSTDAVQVLGGGGFLRDLPVERYMRDAKLMQIGGGTDEVQQMVLARTLLGDF